MANTNRVLIADRNRYHALLLEREIQRQLDGCVTSVFRAVEPAVEELRQNAYAIAVLDCSFTDQSCRDVLTIPNGMIPPEIPSDERSVTTCVIKDGTFHLQVPQLIQYVCENGTFMRNGRPIRPRLSGRRKADMINITAKTLAHEINNPLMTILGTAELITDDCREYSTEVRSKIKVIQESARRIQAIIDHLARISDPSFRSTPSGRLIDTETTG
jgi:signal transduction histidine kinase